MTSEEKAKAYDEAIKRGLDYIRQTPATEMVTRQDVFEAIFPEYAESEDEKMVVKIARTLSFAAAHNLITDYDELIAMQNWLEKQKELFESGRGLYYYDGEKTIYCGDPATAENPFNFAISQHKRQKECLADSSKTSADDERIRKALIDALKTSKSVGELKFILPEPTREECIAYLEKQKNFDKMIVVSPEVWDKAISDAYENGEKDGKKQKEHQFCPDAPKEKSVGGYFLSSSHKDKNLDEIAQDYVDGVKEFSPEPTWDLMQTAVCYGYHYCEQKEQEPSLCDECKKKPTCLDTKYGDDRVVEQCINFVKMKPAEWSEEDENMAYFVNQFLEYHELSDPTAKSCKKWFNNRLKSLRPHWKPSEEQIKAIRLARSFVMDDFDEHPTLSEILMELEEQLKKLM